MQRSKSPFDRFLRKTPRLGKRVYIARSAVVIGDVTVGDASSIWYHAVMRGDINRIVVGRGTNIQDNTVIHLAEDHPCLIGDHVTVGHAAIVHACTVENEVLIGMGAVILDGARVGTQSIVGAKALVPLGMHIPPGSLVLGVPARVVRRLTPAERKGIKQWAASYVANAAYCLKHRIQVGKPLSSRPAASRSIKGRSG